MKAQTHVNPWWAALTVWGVVNAVNVLQAAGFQARVYTGSRTINHILGYVIVALAVPSTVALVAFVRARAGWRQWIGPGVFLAFIALMVVVEYVWVVEFRSPMRYDILVPYLVLFFGSIKFYKARSTFNYQKISLEIPLHFQIKRISLRVFTQKGE